MSKRDDIALRVLSKLQQHDASVPSPSAAVAPSSPFSSSPSAPSSAASQNGLPSGRVRSMHTFIGQVGEQMTQGFAARVEQLERERREGLVILALDPKQIRRAAQANRHALSLTEADGDFATLKQSLRRDGQIMPVSVRALEGDARHGYELVSGHRRHEAALQLDRELPEGFRLRAVLDSAAQEPVTLALHMYLENAARKDLSAYEIGAMFRTWLAGGIFTEQQQISEATGLGKATISKYLQVANLPGAVLDAFGDPRVIAVRWAEILVAALKANEAAVLAAAQKLKVREERPAPEIVLRQLADAAAAKRAKRSGTQSETVKIDGRTAFAYSLRNERIAIRFGKHVDREVARELTEEIKELLTRRLKARLGRGAGR